MINDYVISAYQPVVVHEPNLVGRVARVLQRKPKIDRIPQNVFYITFDNTDLCKEYELRGEVRSIIEGSSNKLELKNLWEVRYVSARSINELIDYHVRIFGGKKKSSREGNCGLHFVKHWGENFGTLGLGKIEEYYDHRSKILTRDAVQVLQEEGVLAL